jgi:hypothetical protein
MTELIFIVNKKIVNLLSLWDDWLNPLVCLPTEEVFHVFCMLHTVAVSACMMHSLVLTSLSLSLT